MFFNVNALNQVVEDDVERYGKEDVTSLVKSEKRLCVVVVYHCGIIAVFDKKALN